MSDLDIPPPAPGERYGVIETDQFCPCGYNLHNARVERDERLGLPVVRCPECGRFAAAGAGSSAQSVWLRRLGTLLLFVWALLLAAVAVAASLATWGISTGHYYEFTTDARIDPDTGRVVVERWVKLDLDPDGELPEGVGTTTNWQTDEPMTYTYRYTFADTGEPVPAPSTDRVRIDDDGQRFYDPVRIPHSVAPEDRELDSPMVFNPYGGYTTYYAGAPTWRSTLGFSGGMVIGGLILGVLQAAALWHLRWPAKLIPPMLVAALAVGLWLIERSIEGQLGAYANEVIVQTLLTVPLALLVGWIVGLLIGRPVARGVARLIVPPKPRQSLAFLWHADGKTMPA